MALILVRHTRTAAKADYCYGNQEVPLAETFEQEVESLLSALPEPRHIFSSPSSRCYTLAQRLAGHFTQATLSMEERLQEMDFGAWQGRSWSEIPHSEVDAWADDFFDSAPHGGETVSEFANRVASWLQSVDLRGPEPVVAVTHKGVMRAALAQRGHPEAWQWNPGFGEVLDIGRGL